VRVSIYLFFALVVTFFNSAKGQILFGPNVGVQYSWTSFGDKEVKASYKIRPVFGYHAGVGASIRVRNRFFLTSSLLYSTKGKVLTGIDDKLLRHEASYRFIEMPIVYSVDFKARMGGNHEFKYFLGIGPNISYWLGGKGTLYNSDYFENNIPEVKYKIVFNKDENSVGDNEMAVEKANRVMLGLNLAAGLAFEPMPNQKFVFMLRYEFGHSYFSADHNGYFADTYYQDLLRSRSQGGRVSLLYLVDTRTGERKKGKSTSHLRSKPRKKR